MKESLDQGVLLTKVYDRFLTIAGQRLLNDRLVTTGNIRTLSLKALGRYTKGSGQMMSKLLGLSTNGFRRVALDVIIPILKEIVDEEADKELTVKNLVDRNPDEATGERDKDAQIRRVTDKMLELRRKLKDIRSGKPTRFELMEIADTNRKKVGTLNYSAIGRQLGRSYHTVQRWCREYRIE